MNRHCFFLLLPALIVIACQKPQQAISDTNNPEPPQQLKLLEKFVGTWSESSDASGAESDNMSADASESTQTGGNVADWALDGMYLRTEAWQKLPDGGKIEFVEYKYWDPKSRKFRLIWFNTHGMTGEGWMTASEDGKTFDVTASGVSLDGVHKRWSGSITFTGANTAKWTWTERGPGGTVTSTGVNERQF